MTILPTLPFPKTLLLLPIFYITTLTCILLSPKLQALLTYYHYFRPPAPPSLKRSRLLSHARNIKCKHLQGWHLLPSGPPFPTTTTDYDKRLSATNQTVFIYFHGTCGTRAFPATRVSLVKTLSAHLDAHVVTFDYSGFADSHGSPSEDALVEDARLIYDWVVSRIHTSTNVVLYGTSLGSFPALSLASSFHNHSTKSPLGVITESALSSLLDALLSHPAGLPLRIFPGHRALYHRFLRERLDNLANIANVHIPILIMHGLNDRQIGVDQARLLYDTAVQAGNTNVDIALLTDCGHNDVATSEHFLNVLWSFVNKCHGELV